MAAKTKLEMLNALTKDALLDVAEKCNVVKVKASMKKDEMIELIAKNKKVKKSDIPSK